MANLAIFSQWPLFLDVFFISGACEACISSYKQLQKLKFLLFYFHDSMPMPFSLHPLLISMLAPPMHVSNKKKNKKG
jgi:hypothetical protein